MKVGPNSKALEIVSPNQKKEKPEIPLHANHNSFASLKLLDEFSEQIPARRRQCFSMIDLT
jgi:hypothetical protein